MKIKKAMFCKDEKEYVKEVSPIIKDLLISIGENPNMEGLAETPKRVVEGYFYSNCEHHMVPFFGKAIIAYIPDKKIIGISKLGRILDFYAARLQVQERLTQQVAKYIETVLKPKGVDVVLHARQLCREMRRVKKFGALMTTSSLLGAFRDNTQTRNEFMTLVQNRLNHDSK